MLHPSSNFLEQALAAVETELDDLTAALLSSDPTALQTCSEKLRQVAVDFITALDSMQGRNLPLSMQERVRHIHAALSVQRDSLVRLAAMTDRQVASILPQKAPSATYANGLVGQPTGMASAARIYSAAG